MSNQDRLLSDEELLKALGFTYVDKEGGYYIHHYVRNENNPSSLNSVLIPHVAEKIVDLINTQKRLYAEELVVNADTIYTNEHDRKLWNEFKQVVLGERYEQ